MPVRDRYKLLSSPLFVISVTLLLLNDMWWKAEFGNFFTGKLSDFAGLFAFGVFLSLFSKQKKLVLGLVGLFFVFWKSDLSTPLISWWNAGTPFDVQRVVDYGDLFALSVLPLAYWYQSKPRYTLRLQPTIAGIIAFFAFVATSESDTRTVAFDHPVWFIYEYTGDEDPLAYMEEHGYISYDETTQEYFAYHLNGFQYADIEGKYIFIRCMVGEFEYNYPEDENNREALEIFYSEFEPFFEFFKEYGEDGEEEFFFHRVESLDDTFHIFNGIYRFEVTNGLPDGVFESWYADGSPKESGEYSLGFEVGSWTKWDADGRGFQQDEYSMGKLVSSKYFLDNELVNEDLEPGGKKVPLSGWGLIDLFMITVFAGFFAFRKIPKKEFTRDFTKMNAMGCFGMMIIWPVIVLIELILAAFLAATLAENIPRFAGSSWDQFGDSMVIAPFLWVGGLVYHLQKRDFSEWVGFYFFLVSSMLTFNYLRLFF